MLILWQNKFQKFIRDLTVKNLSGWNFTPRVIFTINSLTDFQTLNRHEITIKTIEQRENSYLD